MPVIFGLLERSHSNCLLNSQHLKILNCSQIMLKSPNFSNQSTFCYADQPTRGRLIISLMSPTPCERMPAKDAIQHEWIDQLFPYHRNSFTLSPYNETHATSMIGSMTEEFATRNTIKSSEAPETTIPMKIEELGTLPPLPAIQKMARGNSTHNATSHSSLL